MEGGNGIPVMFVPMTQKAQMCIFPEVIIYLFWSILVCSSGLLHHEISLYYLRGKVSQKEVPSFITCYLEIQDPLG